MATIAPYKSIKFPSNLLMPPTILAMSDSEEVSAKIPDSSYRQTLDREIKESGKHIRQSGWRGIGKKFAEDLYNLLKYNNVEYGYSHPAEQLIERTLKTYGDLAVPWIFDLYDKNVISQPQLTADILKCLGRLNPYLIYDWGYKLALKALSHGDIEVRETAIAALELWGGEEALLILKNIAFNESTLWLKKYIEQIISDLAE